MINREEMNDKKTRKVAVIGYGLQGMAVVSRLNSQENQIKVFDLDEKALKLAANNGISTASSLRDVVTGADYILIIVTAGNSAKEILLNPSFLKCLTTEQKVIQMGTYSPQDALEIAEQFESDKIAYVECILSAPHAAVMAGACFLLYGGNKNYLNELGDLLKPIGNILYIGDVGKAAIFNLANLNVVFALINSFALSAAMIERSDMDLEPWLDFCKSGFGAGADNLFKMLTDFFWPAHFKARTYQIAGPIQLKTDGAANETEIITTFTAFLELNTKLTDSIKEAYQEAERNSKGQDWSAVYEILVPK
jgi:3-hydroxyisobutyrate dehydrogenase-like beta-hydroxyacid dehydrogenase